MLVKRKSEVNAYEKALKNHKEAQSLHHRAVKKIKSDGVAQKKKDSKHVQPEPAKLMEFTWVEPAIFSVKEATKTQEIVTQDGPTIVLAGNCVLTEQKTKAVHLASADELQRNYVSVH